MSTSSLLPWEFATSNGTYKSRPINYQKSEKSGYLERSQTYTTTLPSTTSTSTPRKLLITLTSLAESPLTNPNPADFQSGKVLATSNNITRRYNPRKLHYSLTNVSIDIEDSPKGKLTETYHLFDVDPSSAAFSKLKTVVDDNNSINKENQKTVLKEVFESLMSQVKGPEGRLEKLEYGRASQG